MKTIKFIKQGMVIAMMALVSTTAINYQEILLIYRED